MKFEDIIGQVEVKKHLQQTIDENRVPHAQLFLGNQGFGTLPMAITYAKEILCSNSKIDQTSAKAKCDKLIHPDLHFIFPVNTTAEVKRNPTSKPFLKQFREAYLENPYLDLNQWLEFIGVGNKQGIINVHQAQDILKDVYLKPFESDFKVVVIWMAEKLHPSASNKLLKVIEEPPEKTVFLLVTEDQEQIITTILSRTQIVQFKRLHKEEIKAALQENYSIGEDQVITINNLCNGSYNEALKLLQHNEVVLFNRNNFIDWMRLAFRKDLVGIQEWVEGISVIGREKQKAFLEFGLHIFREAMVLNHKGFDVLQLDGEESKFVKNFAPFVHQGNLKAYMDLFNESIYHIERNANPRILFLDLTITVMKLMKMKNPSLTQA